MRSNLKKYFIVRYFLNYKIILLKRRKLMKKLVVMLVIVVFTICLFSDNLTVFKPHSCKKSHHKKTFVVWMYAF